MDKEIKSNRRGKFRIEESMIQDLPEVVMDVMACIIVVRAEQLWCYDAIEYYAISPMFDEIEDGVMVPEYDVVIENNDGQFKFKEFVRKDPPWGK